MEEVARKLGGPSVLGALVRSQAELAMTVRNRLPSAALEGLSLAGFTDHEVERFVIALRARRPRAEKTKG